MAVPEDPAGFLLNDTTETAQLVAELLFDPLYRLDETLSPQPAMAAALPKVSDDGLTWSIELRSGARFHNGARVTADDAALSLLLALSPDCPFERALCDRAAANVATVDAPSETTVRVTLRAPWSPLTAEVLAQLPILSSVALREGVGAIVSSAGGLDAAAVAARVEVVTRETNAERCLAAVVPSGCRLSDYAAEMTEILKATDSAIPPAERFTGADGVVDAEAHGAALLGAVSSLVRTLRADGVDGLAAGAALLDATRTSLGGGPFRLDHYAPGETMALARHAEHLPAPASLTSIIFRVLRDRAGAATALRAGDVDWVVDLGAGEYTGLADAQGIAARPRPAPVSRSIIFNVRPSRIYAQPELRRAFSLCLDRERLVSEVTGGTATPARAEMAAGSWALAAAPAAPPPDPALANQLLDGAGWDVGSDGIRVRGGQRLASEVVVRPGRDDVVAFGSAAADQLRGCGIELVVQELDASGELALEQLRWPNDFETVLVSHTLNADPATDLAIFESTRATTADNPADANPGGYRSPAVDALLARGRTTGDVEARLDIYGQLVAHWEGDPPSIPLWYETAFAAISNRISDARGEAIHPERPRYWWDAWSWKIGPSGAIATQEP